MQTITILEVARTIQHAQIDAEGRERIARLFLTRSYEARIAEGRVNEAKDEMLCLLDAFKLPRSVADQIALEGNRREWAREANDGIPYHHLHLNLGSSGQP